MNRQRSTLTQQRGAALVVGLIMLLVLTLISLSALKNTQRQQRMTTNNEHQVQTFAAAEAAIRDFVNEVRYLREPPPGANYVLREAIDAADDGTTRPQRALNSIDHMNVQATLQYLGTSAAPGSTLNLGAGQGYVSHNFQINALAVLEPDDPISQSFHTQGLSQLGPGGAN